MHSFNQAFLSIFMQQDSNSQLWLTEELPRIESESLRLVLGVWRGM